MLKEVFSPSLGMNIKLGGRKTPRVPALRRKLTSYIRKSLPSPPSIIDWRKNAISALKKDYLNKKLGICVVAGAYHILGVETGNADPGNPFIPTDDQLVADYGAIGGYKPGDPSTDNGCDMQTSMRYFQYKGFASGDKIVGWLPLDSQNAQEIATALWLFENVNIGMALPNAWVNPFPSGDGTIWDVAGDPNPCNGHCIIAAAEIGATGLWIDTWGLDVLLTYNAIKKYGQHSAGGEIYTILMQSQLLQGQMKAPNGFDWVSLISDFNTLGGSVPIPTPDLAPAQAPTITLAQAQQWAAAGLASRWPTKK